MSIGTLTIAIVAGEASGDQLGASLVRALRAAGLAFNLIGVGGDALAGEGQTSFFPQSDIAVMGVGPVLRRLPLIIRRIHQTVREVVAAKPDLLITIDSPDFCKRVARKVRRLAPGIPHVHWVCPSVWAWRPGRAPAMRPYIDHILCLLPFEPEELAKLKGPTGTYIGHPLIERLAQLRPHKTEEIAARADLDHPTILVLPGSRMSEIRRLLPVFMETKQQIDQQLATQGKKARWVMPTLPHLIDELHTIAGAQAQSIEIVTGEVAKWAAFRQARAALAASGTVTLELALAMVPLVAGYRVAPWEAAIARRLIKVASVILPNLILHQNIVPEFLQKECNAHTLAPLILSLIEESPARAAQLAAFERLEHIMQPDLLTPSEHAAQVVLDLVAKARNRSLP